MTINISSYLKLNLKQILTNGGLIFGIILSIAPSIALSYSILKLGGPFNILHVSSFFCIFGIIVPVILATSSFLKDFHYGTISMVYSTSKNRIRYFISNIIIAALLGGGFGAVGYGTLYVYSKLGVPGILYPSFPLVFILNFILCVVFFTLCSYISAMFFEKTSLVYIVLILAIEILPNLLGTLRLALNNHFLDNIIDNFPFYFLLTYIPSSNLSISQYINLTFFLVILFCIGMALTQRKDV